MDKLTIKQDAFVKAYLLNGGNATQAAIEAGYSKKTAQQVGSENLLKPVIDNSIKEHQEMTTKAFIWSKEEKLTWLQDVIEQCAVHDKEKGMLNPNAAVSALKEHNAMQGDNAPTETNSTLNIVQTDDNTW